MIFDSSIMGYESNIEIARLLQPIDVTLPAGESLRYAPTYGLIKEARLEDDPSLPMGEWERPLKKADWRVVQRLCEQALEKQSKDLQLGCWLMESWVRLNGISGLTAGAYLLQGLLHDFWDGIHPVPDEDGDLESRAAPFSWANTQMEQILLLHVPLFPFDNRSPAFISLNDWQQSLAAEFGGATKVDSEGAIGRDFLLECALSHLSTLAQLDSDILVALKAWHLLVQKLDEKFQKAAPSVSRVTSMLEKMQLGIRSLLQNRDPRQQPALAPVQVSIPPMDLSASHGFLSEGSSVAVQQSTVLVKMSESETMVGSRDQAYQLLEMVADYLESNEPHSPTPYLIKRAVIWGRLSLPELMQEVLREEGDLNRYFSMLGIKNE